MHNTPHSEETKLKISLAKKGKPSNRKGMKHSIESCKRMSEAKKGHHHSVETRHKMSQSRTGEGNHFWGKVHSQSSKEKQSLAKHVFYENGGMPPNYIEDRSKLAVRQKRNDSAYKEWRKQVRYRDNWECQLANGSCEGKVIAHHIKPWSQFPAHRYNIKNGITLCHFHHPRTRDGERKLAPQLLAMVWV